MARHVHRSANYRQYFVSFGCWHVTPVTNPENISQHGLLHVGINKQPQFNSCLQKTFPNLTKNQVKVIRRRSRDYKNYMQRNFNFELSNALLNMVGEMMTQKDSGKTIKQPLNYVSDIHAPIESRSLLI